MSYTIQIIGTVGTETPFSEAIILELLQQDSEALKHGEVLTGRPGTKIYLGPQHVCKVHGELKLDSRSAERWIVQALAKEQSYAIHHPRKTWFLALADDPETPPLIGNICPRLLPLHTELTGLKQAPATIDELIQHLQALFDIYFRIAAHNKIRLDEGLSNFGVDDQGKVYYLDDDIYNWDRFISCAHMIGVYLRHMSWLTQTQVEYLGRSIGELIEFHFQDNQYVTVLAEQLRDIFMPSELLRTLLAQFSNALTQQGFHHLEVGVEYRKDRYIALLADIHGNLPALEATLAFLAMKKINRGLVLGDVVGYGPFPNECIERIKQTRLRVIKGNHDQGLASGNYVKGFSKTASWALEWSDQRVTAAHKAWLANLPPVLHGDGWLALHGAPVDPTFFNAYVYEMTYERNLDFMEQKKLPLCFHGHTHLQGLYARKPGRADQHYHADSIDLNEFAHALICPGSVGQPRDYRIGSQFAIYDQEQHVVHFHLLPYNVEKIAGKMDAEGFPSTLINLLRNNHAH